MQKNFIRLTVLLASLMAAFAACSVKEEPWSAENALPDGIHLRFFCDELVQTKATKDTAGVSPLNENLMASVEFFLYPEGHTNENAVYSDYLTNVDPSKWNTIPLTEVFVNQILCPSSAKTFRVYAIANYPRLVADVPEGQSKDLSNTSVPVLEALTQDIETEGAGIAPVQSKFLMSTDGAFQVTGVQKRQSTVAAAEVKLKRNAAKLSIYVHVTESVTITNTVTIGDVTDTRHEVWIPDTQNMEIYLVNGALTGEMSGLPYAGSAPFTYQSFALDMTKGVNRSYTNYVLKTDSEGHPLDANDNIIDPNDENAPDLVFLPEQATATFYPCEYPFYTYPQNWEFGALDEPYIKLMIPWYRQAGVSTGGNHYGTAQKSYYYRVYCPGTSIDGSHAEFLRNHWYEIFLNVSILGSETDGGSLLIPGSYYVVDWQERSTGSGGSGSGEGSPNDSDKEVDIKGARYLFVNKEEYFLYNVDPLSIPYITSDPCEIVNFQGKKYIFSGSSKTESTTNNMAAWNVTLQTVSNTEGAHISFNHPLNNDTSGTEYDVSEYEFTFTLRQSSNHEYSRKITIHQYPAIMIDMEANTGSGTNQYGYAFVNASSGTNDSNKYTSSSVQTGWTYYLGSAPGSGNSSNNNRNMIVIETTVLPSDSDYMLGDPRTAYIDNLNLNWGPSASVTDRTAVAAWSYSSPAVEGGDRKLKYMYPVNSEHAADNIIAPKFRIASSWGATQPMTYANAHRRCASYQEDGYPAGRWRLPTVAEIQYITKLNFDGKIERLLGSTSIRNVYNNLEPYTEYWCNSGYMIIPNGTKAEWKSNYSQDPPLPELGTDATAVTSTSTTKYIRCVYDDWYWKGSAYPTVTPKATFKWGDVPRTSNN